LNFSTTPKFPNDVFQDLTPKLGVPDLPQSDLLPHRRGQVCKPVIFELFYDAEVPE
jgi:hypothetical protein